MRKSNTIRIRGTHVAITYLFIITAVCPTVYALSLGTDGYASLRVLCATDRLVLCQTDTSGDIGLFALDAKTGKLLWRKQGLDDFYPDRLFEGPVEIAVYEDNKAIGITERDELICRSLSNGDLLWRTNLTDIKPPEAARSEKYDPVIHVPDPNHIWPIIMHAGPFVTGDNIIVFRTLGLDGLTNDFPLYQDWMSFSTATGKLLKQGAGRFLGQVGGQILVNVSDPDLGREDMQPPEDGGQIVILNNVTTGEESPIESELLYKAGWRAPNPSDNYTATYSNGNRCLIERYWLGSCIFDGRTTRLTALSQQEDEPYWGWVLLRDYVISYSPLPKAPEPLYIVVRDFDGKTKDRTTLPVTHEDSLVDYAGTTANDYIMLLLHSWKAERLLTFEVPSLKLIADIKLYENPSPTPPEKPTNAGGWVPTWASDRNRSWSGVPLRNSDTFHEIIGDGLFHVGEVGPDGLRHALVIRAINPITGEERWKHSEWVTVKTMSHEEYEEMMNQSRED